MEGNTIPMPQAPQGTPQTPQISAGADVNTRLSGPNIPPELQGKTIGEALQTYAGMRQVVLQMVPGPQQPALPALPTPVPQPRPAAPVAQPAGPPAGAVPEWDWRYPQAAISAAVGRELDTRLAPLLQRESQNNVQAARAQMVQEFGGAWNQLAPMVEQRLAGADAEALQNPMIWRVATEAVVGQLALRSAQQQGAVAQVAQTAVPQMRVQGQPMPNLNGFFTEAPNTGAAPVAPAQLSAQQEWVRGQMGMTVDEYFAWSGGGVRR
jgi:hypothetical protein